MKNGWAKLFPYLLAGVCPLILALGLFELETHFNPVTVALILLLAVLFIATGYGSKPALAASVIAMLCFNFFFLPPIGTFTISETENLIALFVFLVVAITAGELSAKAKRRAEEAEKLYRELQKAFEKASEAEALRRSEKLKSALLDAVTHDLRTPLTSIKASATMLIEELEQDSIHVTLEREGRRELLEVIDEETDRLNEFIQSMVELARLEAGEPGLRKTQIRVEEIVSNALQRAASLTIKHRVSVNIEENLPQVSVDSRALSEVLYNLLDNAAKYSPENSEIRVECKKANDYLRISVEDEGMGIAPEEREKVFQKFYRGEKKGKGFGIGLAIVRGIVEAHRGKIWIEKGKIGSKFVLELPLKADE